MFRMIAIAVGLLAGLSAAAAQSTGPSAQRVRGTIVGVDGPTLVVKPAEGEAVRVKLAADAAVFAVSAATLAEIKVGDFVGVGAMPQPDGSQRAIQVTIFAESMRGIGEGFRPWNRPNSTMTNATVETSVAGVNGRELLVKYKGGEKTIVVPPEATITAIAAGERSELAPGAAVSIFSATKGPDGSFVAARISVGRGGYAPQ